MNYISSPVIPKDIWYVISMFLPARSLMLLSTFEYTIFAKNSIVYQEYYKGSEEKKDLPIIFYDNNYKAWFEALYTPNYLNYLATLIVVILIFFYYYFSLTSSLRRS